MAAQDWLDVYSKESRQRGLYITHAQYEAATSTVHVTLATGLTISFAKERAQALARATDEQLREIEISAAGWSVDFPSIDDGITLEGLLSFRFGNAAWERAWAEKHSQSQAA